MCVLSILYTPIRFFSEFSGLLPQFQNAFSSETIQMKMILICMKMDLQVKHIFI